MNEKESEDGPFKDIATKEVNSFAFWGSFCFFIKLIKLQSHYVPPIPTYNSYNCLRRSTLYISTLGIAIKVYGIVPSTRANFVPQKLKNISFSCPAKSYLKLVKKKEIETSFDGSNKSASSASAYCFTCQLEASKRRFIDYCKTDFKPQDQVTLFVTETRLRLFEAEDDKSSNKRVVIVVDLEQYFGQKFALDEIRDEPFTKEKVDQNTKLLDNELGNQNSKMVCTYSIEHLNMGTSKGERNYLLLDRDEQQYWPK